MANKPRTPPPPRQQGPRKRASVQTPGAGRRPRSALFSGVLVGGVIGVAVLLFFLTRGSNSQPAKAGPSPAAALAAAGCTFKTYPSLGQAHVQSLDAKVKYNSFPPTSGPHYQYPGIWGKYATPLVLVQEVHNLEHGGVVIQYGDKVPQGTIEQLASFYGESPNAMLLAPLPQLGAKIALTAW